MAKLPNTANTNLNSGIFESHWKNADLLSSPPSKKNTALSFLKSSELPFHNLPQGFRILDAGCGNGVHAEVIQDLNSRVAFVGVDISSSAISHCLKKFPEWGAFSVADISSMEFPDESFDLTLCYGVLFYTANPLQTMSELSRVTKKDGLIGIWYMPQSPSLAFKVFRKMRVVLQILGPKIATVLLHFLVPFLFFIPTQSKVNLKNASWAECLEVLKVNFIPNVIFPADDELNLMLRECNLRVVKSDLVQNRTVWLSKL